MAVAAALDVKNLKVDEGFENEVNATATLM